MNNTYIDIHVLQTVPPSNLNRDDAGSPKQAVFGGVRRARVSSQAWKRSTRLYFVDRLPKEQRSTRTKRIEALLTERIEAKTQVEKESATRLARALLVGPKITAGKKETETAYLLFFGVPQLDSVVDLIADRVDELVALDDDALGEAVKEIPVVDQLKHGHPVDVALFGRMVADLASLNVDAATQVAHALSTHAVEIEFDYFTAVDDEKDTSTEDAGAAMIGTIEFNSSTLYRYATVGLNQLIENLDGDGLAATGAVVDFIEGFVKSMPTGKQNSFANRTLPSTVVVVVREDQPVNLVSAFESPVPGGNGLVTKSTETLARELTKIDEQWTATPLLVASLYDPDIDGVAEAFGPAMAFDDLLGAVRGTVGERAAESVA